MSTDGANLNVNNEEEDVDPFNPLEQKDNFLLVWEVCWIALRGEGLQVLLLHIHSLAGDVDDADGETFDHLHGSAISC